MSVNKNDLLIIPDFLKCNGNKKVELPTTQKINHPVFEKSTPAFSLTAKPLIVKPRSPKLWGFIIKDKLEDYIDEGTVDKAFNLITTYKSKSGLISYLETTFTAAKWEMENARSEDLAEYFENISDEDIETRLIGYIRILQDIKNIQQNKRAGRKSNVRGKVIKAVSNVSYKTSDLDLKVTSVDPTSIIGASSLLIFNTKSRRISYFVSADESGLQITGTTIKNFDEEKSISKTIRKPEEQIQHFRQATSSRRVTVLLTKSINGKLLQVSGRLNKDTLLLKVFK